MAAFNSPSIPLPSVVVVPNNETVGGTLGVGTTKPLALLQVGDAVNTQAPVVRVIQGKFAAAPTGTYNAEVQTYSDTYVHGTLLKHNENNVARDVLDISNSTTVFASFRSDGTTMFTTDANGGVVINPTTNPTTSNAARNIRIGESSGNASYGLCLGYFTDGTYKGAIQAKNAGSGADIIINENGGSIAIGRGSASYLLHLNSDSAGKPGAGGLWTVVSDERIKADIVPADLDRCYEIVKSVPLKHFGFKPGVYTDEQIQDKHSLGWIAQDVQQVFEKAVSVKPFTVHTPQADGTVQDEVIEDCLDLNSGQMIAALYGCVQALMAKVEALEARG